MKTPSPLNGRALRPTSKPMPRVLSVMFFDPSPHDLAMLAEIQRILASCPSADWRWT